MLRLRAQVRSDVKKGAQCLKSVLVVKTRLRHMNVHLVVHISVHLYVCTFVCVRACVCACVCVRVPALRCLRVSR